MNKAYAIIPLAVAAGVLIFPFVAFYGSNIMVIKSDSMVPALMPHDLIIVQSTDIDDIKEGDIIAFDSHMQGIGIIAHRALEVNEIEDEILITTKGDNIETADPWSVYDEDLIGKVTEIIPTMGIFFVDPVRYSLAGVIIITSVSLLWEAMSESKKTQKKNHRRNTN